MIIQALSCCTKGRCFPWPDRFRFRSSLMYTCVWNGSNSIFSNAVISAFQWQATHSMGQAHLIQTYSQILPLMLSDRTLSLNEILPLKQVFGVCILKYVNSITFKHHQYLSHALNISMSQKRISVPEKTEINRKKKTSSQPSLEPNSLYALKWSLHENSCTNKTGFKQNIMSLMVTHNVASWAESQNILHLGEDLTRYCESTATANFVCGHASWMTPIISSIA